MKKIFVVMAAMFVLLLCGCADVGDGEPVVEIPLFSEADFIQGSHKRSEDYMASFKFRSVEWEGLRLCIAENIFEAEGSSEMAGNIVGSYLALKSLEPSLAAGGELYVVSISPTGGPVLLDGKLYVNVSMIETGDYMPYMAELVYGAGSRWQQEGLALMARGVQADEYAIKAELIEFLSKNPDTCIMSLHPCYFVEDFAAEDTRHMASMLAYGLTEYIAGETGLAGFLSGGDNLMWRQN